MIKGLIHLAVTALLALSLTNSPVHAEDTGSSIYGQRLITEYVLTPEDIAIFAAHQPSAPDPKQSAMDNMLLADTEDWVGPVMVADSTINPYTFVVTLTGTARSAGDVITSWRAGWQLENGGRKLQPFAGQSESTVDAGEQVVITMAAPSTRFSSNQPVQPVLSLVKAQNVELQGIKVQLWSGVGDTTAIEGTFAYYGVFLALVMVILIWRLRS